MFNTSLFLLIISIILIVQAIVTVQTKLNETRWSFPSIILRIIGVVLFIASLISFAVPVLKAFEYTASLLLIGGIATIVYGYFRPDSGDGCVMDSHILFGGIGLVLGILIGAFTYFYTLAITLGT